MGGSAGRVAMVVLGCVVTALASAIAAIVAFFGVAWIADAVWWAALTAVIAAAAVAVAVTSLLTRGSNPMVRRRSRLLVSAVVVVAVLVAGQQLIVTPFDDDRLADTVAPDGLSWWTLAGGERLAYLQLAPPP